VHEVPESLQNNKLIIIIVCAARGYQRREAMMGDTLTLWCGTEQTSEVKWTRNTTAGHYRNVYVNGSITRYQNFPDTFSVVSAREGEYSLRVYNVHYTDSGLYDCFESNGKRIIGYNLTAKSMFLDIRLHYL